MEGSPKEQKGRGGRKALLTEDTSKNFVCAQCYYRFARAEHLQRHHLSVHTDKKPFQCPTCGGKYCRKDNLQQHQRTHLPKAPIEKQLERADVAKVTTLTASRDEKPASVQAEGSPKDAEAGSNGGVVHYMGHSITNLVTATAIGGNIVQDRFRERREEKRRIEQSSS